MYRTVIADSDPMVLFIYRKYLIEDKRFKLVGELDGGENIVSVLKSARPALLIMGSAGSAADMALLREIYKCRFNTRVILVAADIDAEFFADSLQLGVIDCVLKPFSEERYRAALNRFADMSANMDKLKAADQKSFDFCAYGDSGGNYCRVNTKTALRILDCLRDDPGSYYTVKELADKLGLSRVTVRKYLKELSGAGEIADRIEYGTGGHPSALYAAI